MRVAILSRNKNLHSVRRLLQEARKLRLQCDVINPLDCQVVVDGKKSRILHRGQAIPKYDAILPRIGASITDYGLAVVKQFELLGTRAINGSQSIADSRDKLRCLQLVAHAGIASPATVLTRGQKGLPAAVQAVHGMPVVVKVLKGTQGIGVMMVHTTSSLDSVIDTLRNLNREVIIQHFIEEASGSDYRAFVIGNKVVAAMMRTAPAGEFRSNIHRGGEGALVRLTKPYEKAAIQAARVVGLDIAGVDLMKSRRGPLVIEVNSSPGFEGIEYATGINVAEKIMKHLVTRSKSKPKTKRKGS